MIATASRQCATSFIRPLGRVTTSNRRRSKSGTTVNHAKSARYGQQGVESCPRVPIQGQQGAQIQVDGIRRIRGTELFHGGGEGGRVRRRYLVSSNQAVVVGDAQRIQERGHQRP